MITIRWVQRRERKGWTTSKKIGPLASIISPFSTNIMAVTRRMML